MQKDLVNKKSHILERHLLQFIFLLSFLLRISVYKVQTHDYTADLRPWYTFIQIHGGFPALKYNFADYNPAYLYLLALATYIPLLQPIIAIKTISVLFDAVLALFTYLILRLKYTHSSVPIIGAVVIVSAPTVFMNSAAWGQCDAIFTACCLASLYFLLRKHSALACISFGIAISFKLQAIFFLPVLIVLVLAGKFPTKFLIFIPVTYLALLAPAIFEGRDVWSLLNIYLVQANDYYPSLTSNAPTFYQWLPTNAIQDWKWMGILFAAMIVALMSFLTVTSRKQITSGIILKFTLVFALVIPFFLPEMHERYFYLADVVSIIYAFYFPRYFYVAVIEQLCSLMSYAPVLFQTQMINLAYVAFAVLFLIVVTLADLMKTLYPTICGPAAMPVTFSNDLSSKPSGTATSVEISGDRSSAGIGGGIQ